MRSRLEKKNRDIWIRMIMEAEETITDVIAKDNWIGSDICVEWMIVLSQELYTNGDLRGKYVEDENQYLGLWGTFARISH